MVAGFLGSGLIITKKKPSPSKILLWNVFVGLMFMLGEITYLFLTCPGMFFKSFEIVYRILKLILRRTNSNYNWEWKA